MRIDRPIGTILLLLPCYWGMALATKTIHFRLEIDFFVFILLFALGAFFMRSAGCIINDIFDKDIDSRVERTKNRPLASGVLKVWQAVILLFILLALSFVIFLQFNTITMVICGLAVIPAMLYPLAKRFMACPQLFLGFTFNIGVLAGYTAITNELNLSVFFLYACGIMWTLGYDTIYAFQDSKDDAMLGIGSSALLFKDYPKFWIGLFYAISTFFMWQALLNNGQSILFSTTAILPIILHFFWQVIVFKADDTNICLKLFKSNAYASLLILIGLLL
jgi:4-hydroxybenzoate polyprenyltransferase